MACKAVCVSVQPLPEVNTHFSLSFSSPLCSFVKFKHSSPPVSGVHKHLEESSSAPHTPWRVALDSLMGGSEEKSTNPPVPMAPFSNAGQLSEAEHQLSTLPGPHHTRLYKAPQHTKNTFFPVAEFFFFLILFSWMYFHLNTPKKVNLAWQQLALRKIMCFWSSRHLKWQYQPDDDHNIP